MLPSFLSFLCLAVRCGAVRFLRVLGSLGAGAGAEGAGEEGSVPRDHPGGARQSVRGQMACLRLWQ